MKNEQERWDARYSERTEELPGPNIFVAEHRNLLQRGRVLDLACGDGRNAIYLAGHGFEVVGVDFSAEALRRLQSAAISRHIVVDTYQRNLDSDDGALAALGPFNSVIVVCFMPSLHLLRDVSSTLLSDGIFLITSFNTEQHVRRGFPKEYCLRTGEFIEALEGFELLEYVSYKDGRGYYDGYVFRKQ